MSLHILDPGLASRIVDMGRPNCRGLGVPVGGAADRAALALGNALVGNPPQTPALEICLKGPVMRAETRLEGVLFGALFPMSSARQSLRAGTTFTLEPGEEVHIGATPQAMRGEGWRVEGGGWREIQVGATQQGLRAYLCMRGGLDSPLILGSHSALECIKAGEALFFLSPPSTLRPPPAMSRRFYSPQVETALAQNRFRLRVLPGLQADWFADQPFCEQEFLVTPELDRMGIRLAGRPLVFPKKELVSEPVCPGAIQVTSNGQCIVLGVDGQTIGGYPKIAQVIQADLDHLGQLRPGNRLRFQRADITEAAELFRERQAFLREWITRARCWVDGS